MDPILPIEAARLFAGAAGSLAFAFIAPERKSLWKAIAHIFVGTVTSFWLTPALCEYWDWKSAPRQHALAFLLGLIGYIACKAVIASAESEAAKGFAGVVGRAVKRAFGWPDDEPPK